MHLFVQHVLFGGKRVMVSISLGIFISVEVKMVELVFVTPPLIRGSGQLCCVHIVLGKVRVKRGGVCQELPLSWGPLLPKKHPREYHPELFLGEAGGTGPIQIQKFKNVCWWIYYNCHYHSIPWDNMWLLTQGGHFSIHSTLNFMAYLTIFWFPNNPFLCKILQVFFSSLRVSTNSCISLFLCYCHKTLTENDLQRGNDFFGFHFFLTTFSHWRKQGRNLEAVTEAENMEECCLMTCSALQVQPFSSYSSSLPAEECFCSQQAGFPYGT